MERADAGTALRPMTAADAPALARIHREARAAAIPRLREPWGEPEVVAWIAAVPMTAPRRVILAEAAGASGPAGYLGLEAAAPSEVLHLYVAPVWQRRGVGARLLDAARAAAPPEGLALLCVRRNHGARAFYRRHGFRPIHRRDAAANEEGEPDVRLAWTPPAPPDRTRGANA